MMLFYIVYNWKNNNNNNNHNNIDGDLNDPKLRL